MGLLATSTLCYLLATTLLSAEAITVSVDRTDIRQPEHPSILINGWRPVANYDKSPREHQQLPQRRQENFLGADRQRTSQLIGDYGVLSAFGRLAQPSPRIGIEPKILATDREYTFIVPPVRNGVRYEYESTRKQSVAGSQRDPDPYVRGSQYTTQLVKPQDVHSGPTYYIKPASYVHPFVQQTRPYTYNFQQQQPQSAPQQAQQQQAQQGQTSDKPYQLVNVGNSHYYNQINHPAANFKTGTNYERDPAYLVHESHEVTYTPSSYKYRPSYYVAQAPQSEFTTSRPDSSKRFEGVTTKTLIMEKPLDPNANFVYVTELQKTRFAPDINEVLPKVNAPVKFAAGNAQSSQVTKTPNYVRPELHQYHSSVIPLNLNQRQPDLEYETPESISLKHFNDQQFMLQQQLIQQDRQRLREQEKRRQQELTRKQQEGLKTRQEELKVLEQRQKDKQRMQHQQQLVDAQRVESFKTNIQRPQAIPETEKKPQHYQKPFSPSVQISPDPTETTGFKNLDFQKYEVSSAPHYNNQDEFQPILRPYRPIPKTTRRPEPTESYQKTTLARKKPTTLSYEIPSTEPPTTYATPEIPTDIPIQTTYVPETTSTTAAPERHRTRRPGIPLRRRRPSTVSTTSSTPGSSAAIEDKQELAKYGDSQVQEFEKKKRIKPNFSSNNNNQEPHPERKRVRPANRGKSTHDHSGEIEATTPARIRTTERPIEEISPTENYPQAFLKSEFNPADYTSTTTSGSPDYPTEVLPAEYSTLQPTSPSPSSFPSSSSYFSTLDYYDSSHESRRQTEEPTPLEQLFPRTESTTTTSTTESVIVTSSASPIEATQEVTTTPKTKSAPGKHRMRPMRFGNATRPRFSIKDYKSRMEYKNRLQQSSSTEPSTVTKSSAGKLDSSKGYKFMSRSTYRSTTANPNNSSPGSQQESTSTERTSRFVPKKIRPTGLATRPRFTTTPSPGGDKDKDSSPSKRPENVYSSAIKKPRPTLRSRLTKPQQHQHQHSTEISTAESGPVSPSSSTPDTLEPAESSSTPSARESFSPEPTTPFDVHGEEELFAKASQSVADLTSSASALYDKPGMFKAVSPNGENRAISAHLRIATDEPTLPIEAFFQELSKRN